MKRTILPIALTASAPTLDGLRVSGVVTAADSASRTITGRVVLFGQTGQTNIGPARFTPGALTAADPRRVKLIVEHDVNRVVGYCTGIVEDAQGVTATFHVPPGAAGDEVLASAAAGLRDGLSAGVHVTAATPGADGALEVSAGEWRETSIVALPAFSGSVVTRVAASQPVAPAAPLAPIAPVAPVVPRLTPVAPVLTAARPVDLTAHFQGMAAAYRAEGIDGLMRAALTDVVLPSPGGPPSPGQAQRDAMIPPQWVGELWQARNAGRRPLIDAVQNRPLTSSRVSGMQRTWPAWGVDAYTGNKSAVPSPGTYTLSVVYDDAKRIAGAHDFDRIFLDFPADYGDGTFLESYFTDQTDNYLEKSESLFASFLLAGAFPLGDAPGVVEAIAAAAAHLGARGAQVNFVKVAPDLYAEALAIKQIDAPWLIGGSANLTGGAAGGTANIGDITIEAEPSFAPGAFLAGDSRSATFFEWKNPPLRVEALNIPNGGVDLGVFGYWARLMNDAASVVSMTVTPAAQGFTSRRFAVEDGRVDDLEEQIAALKDQVAELLAAGTGKSGK